MNNVEQLFNNLEARTTGLIALNKGLPNYDELGRNQVAVNQNQGATLYPFDEPCVLGGLVSDISAVFEKKPIGEVFVQIWRDRGIEAFPSWEYQVFTHYQNYNNEQLMAINPSIPSWSCPPPSIKDPCENITCDEGFHCVEGECVDNCQNITCEDGRVCRDGICVNQCQGIQCPNGWYCENGICVNPCSFCDVSPTIISVEPEFTPSTETIGSYVITIKNATIKQSGWSFVSAAVYPQYSLILCPVTNYQLAGTVTLSCDTCPTIIKVVPFNFIYAFNDCDPCLYVTCADNESCIDGVCVNLCSSVSCDEGLVCKNGNCVEPCFEVTCPNWHHCVDGVCVECTRCDDPGCEILCDQFSTCIDGQCVSLCDTYPFDVNALTFYTVNSDDSNCILSSDVEVDPFIGINSQYWEYYGNTLISDTVDGCNLTEVPISGNIVVQCLSDSSYFREIPIGTIARIENPCSCDVCLNSEPPTNQEIIEFLITHVTILPGPPNNINCCGNTCYAGYVVLSGVNLINDCWKVSITDVVFTESNGVSTIRHAVNGVVPTTNLCNITGGQAEGSLMLINIANETITHTVTFPYYGSINIPYALSCPPCDT